MCGLVGFFKPVGGLAAGSEDVLRAQAGCLIHRGPDDGGRWLDAAAGIALGHRRLAIIDLTDAGKQPMLSASGRYVLVYNGEIYNHLEMRAEIEAAGVPAQWRGHSDTETLLAGIECWGIEATLRRASGMFAIALWDREARALTLARDRLGEKPLYYGWQGDVFLFGSELKALRAHPTFRAEVDREALTDLMRRGYVSAPRSIYRGINKLPAGQFLTLPAHVSPGSTQEARVYWSLRAAAERGLVRPFEGTDDEAMAVLERELKRAVLQQTIADVPLGAFLSGGIDSTTVVALLQAQLSRRVQTFTIGFHEAEFQEAPHAAAVARHLGTDHSELYVTAADALQVIPGLPAIYDEPFGDSSAIPTHLVARFARRHVTACLSGDGGDELFGGYTRYQGTEEIWRSLRRIPATARRVVSAGCGAFAFCSAGTRYGWMARRAGLYLAARTAEECYAVKTQQWPEARELVLDPGQAPMDEAPLASDDIVARMMYADAMTYLPDDILAKVDRAAMAVSLETRIPLLDHRVVEFAWTLPRRMKLRDGDSKWLLKRLLATYVPDALMRRPKMGFGVPVGEWLRGPLRDWAEDLLDKGRLKREGFLNPALLRARWQQHLDRTEDAADSLWPVLMFQAWYATASDASVHRVTSAS